MTYLNEFRNKIHARDWKGFCVLWEEYCAGDEIDTKELAEVLHLLKGSALENSFAALVPEAIALYKRVQDFDVLKRLMDLTPAATQEVADLSIEELQKRYGQDPHFQEKLRFVGLKNKSGYCGAISHFELLNHLHKGNFVFHTGGWGVGEIMNVSNLREQIELEFEKITGKRELSFANAFKNLIPLSSDHFLAKRFGNADAFEAEAKADPVAVIKQLLTDLGPKTASEIRDELIDYVIPEEDWAKWWQSARTKLKKVTSIEAPASAKEPFRLADKQTSIDERALAGLSGVKKIDDFIDYLYSTLRDNPELTKHEEIRRIAQEQIEEWLKGHIKDAQRLELYFLCEDLGRPMKAEAGALLEAKEAITLVNAMSVLAYKKRALQLIRQRDLLVRALMEVPHSALRDFLVKELTKEEVEAAVEEHLQKPEKQPEFLIWYLPKVMAGGGLPFSDKRGQCRLLEGLLQLLSAIESKPAYKDLTKKITQMLLGDRFSMVRTILQGSPRDFASELILLAAKCHAITDSDTKTIQALVYVAHPDLNQAKKERDDTENVIWTTSEGLKKIQERIRHIGTVETVENAKEIEAARALGDLRENSEFKFALERRARLQGELKSLSDEVSRARVITKEDIPQAEVGIGSRVTVQSGDKKVTYTILGPWDADVEKNILAFQSKLAQSMVGAHVGDTFSFQGEEYRIVHIEPWKS